MRLFVVFVAALLACACSSVPTNSKGWIEPIDAVRAANDDPLHGVRGEFIITVRAVDSTPDQSYLNSEKDYRDQRNLTVRMPSSIVPDIEQRLGVRFHDLRNRRLVIHGLAKRHRIDFVSDGKPTGKYYYQTQVQVSSPTQVRFAD